MTSQVFVLVACIAQHRKTSHAGSSSPSILIVLHFSKRQGQGSDYTHPLFPTIQHVFHTFSYFFVSCTWFSGLAHSITITHVFIFSKYMSIKHCFSILSDLSYIELVCSTFVLFPVTVPNLYFHFGTVGQSWVCHCQCFFATQMG